MTEQFNDMVEEERDLLYEEETDLDELIARPAPEVLEKAQEIEFDAEEGISLTLEEKEQLDFLLAKQQKADFIMQAFLSLEKKPEQEDIDKMKRRYGDVFMVALGEKEHYIFRPIKRKEWVELQRSSDKLEPSKKEELLVMKGVVWPKLNQLNIDSINTGSISTLHSLIIKASNFMDPDLAMTLVRKL